MNKDSRCLFDQIEGEKIMPDILGKFYEKVMEDPVLKPYFDKVDLQAQIKHMFNFLRYALGNTNGWPGRTIRQIHAKHGIKDEQFDAFKKHLYECLADFKIDEKQLQQIDEIIEGQRKDVTNKERFPQQ